MLRSLFSFIQSNDKAFQILAIAIPGLYFTYSYNQWQQYSRQIELSNTLVKSFVDSADQTQQRIALNLIGALPDRTIVRQALSGIPLDQKIALMQPPLVDAVRQSDIDTLNSLGDIFCSLVPSVDKRQPIYKEYGQLVEGYLMQLVTFGDVRNSKGLTTAKWLLNCGAILFPSDFLPPPRTPGDQTPKKLGSNPFNELLFRANGDAEALVTLYAKKRNTTISDLSGQLTERAYEWPLIVRGQLAAATEYIKLLEKQVPLACGNVFKSLSNMAETVIARSTAESWKAFLSKLRGGKLNECRKTLNPEEAKSIDALFKRFLGRA